jgi:NADH dehydrogenase
VKGFENVWGIGDCAVNLDAGGSIYPATAQHAVREAECAARNIAALLRGRTPVPCDITPRGTLAALGCRTAVARVLGVKLSGFPAWFLWRTVYLFKMPGWGRRVRVALDWTMSLLFRRNYVQLGIHQPEMRRGGAPAQSIDT